MTSEEPEPFSGGDCLSCFDELTADNAVEFTFENSTPQMETRNNWSTAKFCFECIQTLIQTQFKKFMKDCVDVDCERTMRALMERGPPIFISDPYAFPNSDGREIQWLRRYDDPQHAFEGKLEGAVTGQERQDLWDHLKGFMVEKIL